MKTIKKVLRTAKLVVVGLALTTATMGSAKAQIGGTFEGIHSFEKGNSYVRPTVTYQLPKEVKGHSFIELYGERGYFGKTTLTKQITGPLSGVAQTVYGSPITTRQGLGVAVSTKIGEKGFGKIQAIPLWMTLDGKLQKEGTLGYYVEFELPHDFKISSFGEVKMKRVPEWGYGEITLEKQISETLSLRYQPAMKNQGSLKPKLEHRIGIQYKL